MKASAKFKAWIAKKWDTAETWLPGFLVAVSIVVIAIVTAVRFFSEGGLREPAAFVEISDSEIPAHTIYADYADESEKQGPLRNLVANQRQKGSPAAKHASQIFVFPVKDSPGTREISKRTGMIANRARAVILAPDLLRRSPGNEIALKLSLFEDTQPVIIFKVVSAYEVNAGIHTGKAEDDPNSHVNLTTADGMISGFIKYQGRSYRIVADPERGIHYIVETQ